jgi:hypothetical protein
MALTAGQIPVLANVPNSGTAIVQGTGLGALGADTNGVASYTAGAYGGRVYSILASSNSTSVTNIFVYILRGSTVVPLGLCPVAISAGNVTGTRNIDFLDGINIAGLPTDNTGKRFVPLQPNDVLKFSPLASLSTFKVFITCHGADYQL